METRSNGVTLAFIGVLEGDKRKGQKIYMKK